MLLPHTPCVTPEQLEALSFAFAESGFVAPETAPHGLFYTPYRPQLNPIQNYAYDQIQQHLYTLLFGERYCIEENALLYVDGGLKRFRRLRPSPEPGLHPMEMEVLSWNGSKTVVEKTSHFFNETSRAALRLDFNNGNHVTVSAWHPLWCAYKTEDGRYVVGFAEARNIAILVELKRQVYLPVLPYPEFARSQFVQAAGISLDEGVAYLLGALCGDGSLNFLGDTTRSVQFTNADAQCVSRVQRELARLGAELKQYRRCQYRINKASRLKALLAALGMATLSKCKRIPDLIIESPAPVIRQFLRGLYDTDGTVEKYGTVIYSTASEGLSKDVQDCLQALGIFSVRRFTPNSTAGCWDVYCMGAEARRFIDEIGFEIQRKSSRRVSAKFATRKAYGYPEFIREEMKRLKSGTANRGRDGGHDRFWHLQHRGVLQCRYVPSPEKLARFKKICGTSDALESLSFTSRWVLVESAAPVEASLCDLKVPKTESFIANGLINHNSGKSVVGVHALVDHCRENFNARALIIVPTGRQGQEGGAWYKLNSFIRADWEKNGAAVFTEPRENKYKDVYIWISNKYGGWSRVVLLSIPYEGFVAPRVKGIEPTFILVDEAQTLETDTYFKHIVQQLGRDPHIPHQPIVYTCNPSGRSHWLYERFFIMPVDEETGDWNKNYFVLHLPISDNKHNLPPAYWERLMDATKGDDTEYRRMVLGEWVDAPSGEALFGEDFNETLHVRPDPAAALRGHGLLPLVGQPIITGWDLGAAHSSVTFEQYIPTKDKILWIIFDEFIFIDRYIPYTRLVPMLLDRFAYWNKRMETEFRLQHISDEAAFNQYRAATGSFDYKDIQDLSKGKIRMVAAPKGPYSIETRVRMTREKLQNTELLISATCPRTKEMFMKLERDPANSGRPKPKSRFGHPFDSMSYPFIYYAAHGNKSMRPKYGPVQTPQIYSAT